MMHARTFFALFCLIPGSVEVVAQNRVGNVVTGRAKLQLLYRYSGSAVLPEPERVIIQDFATEGEVVLERRRWHHHLLHLESGQDVSADDLIRQIQDTFARTVTERLEKEHVATERLQDAGPSSGPELVIRGEFIGVNQGNARKRIMIGFGRGASDIKTHVVITLVADGKSTVLLDCIINSQSGKEPGALASTGGIGIAAGTIVGSLGDRRSETVQADASRMAKLVTEQIVALMKSEKWIANG